MKSVLQNIKNGEITVGDIPQPVLKRGNVLVRNVCSLVSAGTEKAVMEFSKGNYLQKALQRPDLFRKVMNRAKNEGLWQTYQVVSNLIEQPIQLGYSSAGFVVEVGADVSDIQVGQRVACAGLFVATHSEVVSVPRNLLVPIPENVDFEAASFVTLGAIAIQGVRLADLALSENVVVYGLGLVGMLTAQLAVAAGCRVVGIDIDSAKVEKARGFGCQGAVAEEGFEKAVLELCGGYGADKVLLCAATKSNVPINAIPSFTCQKGVVVVVGDVSMDIPRRAYYDKEIDIRVSRSYGPGRYDLSYEDGGLDYPYAYVRWTENRNMGSFLDLLARRRADASSLITHRFQIDEATQAYAIIEGVTRTSYMGMIIRYCEDAPANAVVPSVRYPSTDKPKNNIGIGLLGAGNFAKAFLLPAFAAQPGAAIRAVCTASGVSAVTVAKKYNASLATSNPAEVITASDVDLVVITTRHDSHASYVIDALNAGRAVFVEKPPCLTLEELEAIKVTYEQKREAGKNPFLMVGYNRRFSPLAQQVKQVFAKTKEPLAISYRVNAGHVPATEWVHDPQIGGGRIIGETGHFVDFLTFLCGQPPVAVSGSALSKEKKPVADVVTLTLEFADGSIGSIHYFANGNSSMPKESVEIFGGGICAQLVNFRSLKVFGAKAPGKTSYLSQAKGFAEEAEATVAALREGHGAPIAFEQIYLTSKATLLAEHAILSGTRISLRA
jgi:predicted dehydrogenase/threonine dehydrogenase-like Zn-dependent dehydrogenase